MGLFHHNPSPYRKNPVEQGTGCRNQWHLHLDADGIVDYACDRKGKPTTMPVQRGLGCITKAITYEYLPNGKYKPTFVAEWAFLEIYVTWHYSQEYFQ